MDPKALLLKWHRRRLFGARKLLGYDFFGGWEPEDVALFRKYAVRARARKNAVTDFLGMHTEARCIPWAAHLSNSVLRDLPIPRDGVHGDAIEYFALLSSLEDSIDTFSMVELGASYAPWVCSAALLASRIGKPFNLVAVEANSTLVALVPLHLSQNDIDPSCVRVIHGAISNRSGTCFFPKVQQNDGQISDRPLLVDYLGRQVEHEVVRAYELADVLPDGLVDFVHMDVQGAEASILSSNAALINERVRAIFVATHSRKIEGELLELFHANGWQLVREKPTRFSYRQSLPDIVGWTCVDGAQYWTNPRLKAPGKLKTRGRLKGKRQAEAAETGQGEAAKIAIVN